MVYDPDSTSGDHSGNTVYVDNQMHPMELGDVRPHQQGVGQMVLGRSYTNLDKDYARTFLDDLKMWNRMLTHEEIIEMDE